MTENPRTLVYTHSGRLVNYGFKVLMLLGVGFLLVTALAGWAGYQLGTKQTYSRQTEDTLSALDKLFKREHQLLAEEKRFTQSHLDALAQRLGQMQGEVLRLNALGERLVTMAELDPEEFDFTQLPPVGGPEAADALGATFPEVMQDLTDLTATLEHREFKLNLLEDLIMSRTLQEQTIPSGTPAKFGWISSYYGTRKDPYTGKRAFHNGLDFAGKRGSEIAAVADGLVIFSGYRSGFGRMIEIRHGYGFVTRYAHNQELRVKAGELVHQGQTIATLGSSGRATGPHLHFEVLQHDKPVDPLKYVTSGHSNT